MSKIDSSIEMEKRRYIEKANQQADKNIADRKRLDAHGETSKRVQHLVNAGHLAGAITKRAIDMNNGLKPEQRHSLIITLATLFERERWFDD